MSAVKDAGGLIIKGYYARSGGAGKGWVRDSSCCDTSKPPTPSFELHKSKAV